MQQQHLRDAYEQWALECGAVDASIWLEFASYEAQHGDALRCGVLYERARSTLKSAQEAQRFVVGYAKAISSGGSCNEMKEGK